MGEARSRFIRTVTFGGYDRTDVDRRLDALNSQVYELKNELRDAKLMLDKLRKGTEEEKAHESILAVERAKLTELQVKNEAMSEKLRRSEDDNKNKEKTIAELREENAEASKSLENVQSELSALQAGGDAAALGTVFVEAQKSKDMIIGAARTEADTLKANSETLAEKIVADADNKAAMIIHEAEKRAAEIIAEAATKSEQMKVASQNMKANMLQDVQNISAQIGMLRQAMEAFEAGGSRLIRESENLLADTEKELKRDGVPVFAIPGEVQPVYPEAPEIKPVDFTIEKKEEKKEEKKKNSGLDRLQAMADALEGGKKSDSGQKSGGKSLADLARQAEAIDGGSGDSGSTKKGKVNLADLAKQAEAIGGGDSGNSGNSGGGKKGKLNLADLAKQAEALDKGKK